ncbi:helix-turn-helix transcriptional regulator [Paenibacillus sp. GM2FR]|uniref:helix-turn-helix transcriptional regulator n=1 Tax=Paenibacillus sp. GM2FR TaxID=2059268 RepID=UPI000C27CD95|nr:helix-turn-helix transcriptional regulator [Paenibacillus sp. GM2FR]
METTATIRGEIARYLHEHGLTINQFSKISNINSGSLSSILNGNRPMSVNQLDRITTSIGHSEGYFYDRYIFECIFHTTPDWRRLGAFLQRCAELDKLDCLQLAARMTMENMIYVPMLFETAEEFFNEEKYKAAAILYECVAESEKFQHSERLALCHYRLFGLGLSDNMEANLQLAVTFEHYIDRLDEVYQLEAYRKLINVNISLLRWDTVEVLAEKMGLKAKIKYENNYKYEQEKPVIFYILYSYLIRANVCREAGNFDEALGYLSMYEYTNWITAPTDEETLTINQFKDWAKANRYYYKLMAGHSSILPEYVNYVITRRDEIFAALCNIVIAANRHHFNIDHILEQFRDYLVLKLQRNKFGKVSEQITINQYTRLLAELGIYYLNAKQYDRGLSYILDSLEYSIRIKSDNGMLRCMGIFEQFRQYASEEIQKRYNEFIRNVQKLSVYAWSPLV